MRIEDGRCDESVNYKSGDVFAVRWQYEDSFGRSVTPYICVAHGDAHIPADTLLKLVEDFKARCPEPI